jgi:DNA-binding CsgD family transcriptional regulator/tetratricopeptide (TPR) repeat protein
MTKRIVLRGRGTEVGAALRTLRTVARTGEGAVIVLLGEPGIGKSAVLHAVLEQAGRMGFATGESKADEIDQIAPGAPLLVALRSGPRPLLDSAAFTALAPLYEQKLWLVEKIGMLLEEAAARTPVAIAIDDVQWADPLSRFALRTLIGRLSGSPIAWILASRHAPAEAADELVAAADGAVPVLRLPLARLATEHIDEIARERLGRAPDAAVRELLGGVGGNPFWATQLLDGLVWRTARGLPAEGMHTDLIGGLRQRLRAVGPATERLIRLVAVWGRLLPADTAATLTGGDVLNEARQAEDDGLLRIGSGGLTFPHDVLREAVYADIPPADRDAWHRLCGRHLLRTETSALPAAAHFRATATRDDAEALAVLERAASDSVATMPDQAAELAQEAFALVSPDRPGWLAAGMRTVALLVQVQRDRAVVTIADHLAAGAPDAETAAFLQVQACRALWSIGASRAIEQRVDAILSGDEVSDLARGRLAAIRALASTRTGPARAVRESARAALVEGRRLRDDLTQRMALHALTEAARNEGRHQAVLDLFAELRKISGTAHLAEEIRALQHVDRYDDADTLLARVREEALGDAERLLPSFLYVQIWQDHNLARFDEADRTARTLLRLARETGNLTFELNARMILCGVSIYRGDVPGGRAVLAPMELSEERPRLRLMLGWLAAEEGDLAGSIGILGPLLSAAADDVHAWAWSPPWMRLFGAIGLAAGDRDFAESAARLAARGAERNPGVPTQVGVGLQVRGLLDGDADMVGRAVDVLRGAPRPMLLAQALADHGAALSAAGDPAAATARLEEAADLFARLGVVPGAQAGDEIRALMRGRRATPARPPGGVSSLTRAERRVAELISAGHSSRSAAAELVVSLNTVNTHLRSIFTKLGVRSRVQLANLWRTRPTE